MSKIISAHDLQIDLQGANETGLYKWLLASFLTGKRILGAIPIQHCHAGDVFRGAYERALSSLARAMRPIPGMKLLLMWCVRRIHYLKKPTLPPRIRV